MQRRYNGHRYLSLLIIAMLIANTKSIAQKNIYQLRRVAYIPALKPRLILSKPVFTGTGCLAMYQKKVL